MTVVPFSHTSPSTFKSDVTALANYAKQPVGAADGGTLGASAKRFGKFLQLSPSRLGECCARSQHLAAAERYPVLLGVTLIAMALALVTGCSSSGSVAPPVAIAGSVQGGHGPVSGASVQLYAASSGGLGSAATPLLQKAVASDSNGNFSIPTGYSCPSPSSPVYVVASGGSTSSTSGENSALMLTAMLGPCSGLAALGSVSVNEVTTIGSVWPLAHYFTSPTNLGSAPNDTTLSGAVSSVPEFINLAQGSSPGTPTSTSSFAENNKLYSLADVFAACVSSSGGKAGDGSPCGQLFSMASSAGGSAPADTMTAAIQIAQNPDNNVAGIYGLVKGSTAFEPTVTAAPSDWTLQLTYLVATPSISLATGTYTGTQNVTISDATQGSTIYYTTDGTVPTSSSNVYTAPISIAVSSTIKAIAILTGSSSGVASSTLTIASANPPAKLAFVQQPSNALTGATMSPAVIVAVQDSNGNTLTSATNPVTLALTSGSGLTGTLTATPQNGVATFSNLSIGTAGSYTLSATSSSLTPATSAGFSITAAASTPLPPAKLAFVQQPTSASTGATISPAVTVAVEDSNGNPVTSATNPVTLALVGGTGLAGTLTATPQNGVATFSTLTVSTAGTYTLSGSSPSLTSATSTSFTISTTTTTTNTPAGTVATPVISSSGGTITITDSTPGVGIWYTTDGSTPALPPGGVPQGTSSSYTPMCQPIAQPPLANLKNITAYGAVPGGKDNTTAIANACTAAGPANGSNGIYIPAGTFYYGNGSNAPTLNCSIYGQGPSSELYCPSPIANGGNCTMYSTGSNEVWSNFSHQINTVGEVRDATNLNIYFNGGSNNRTDTLLLIGGSGGIQNVGTTNDIDTNNGIFNTKADSNYHINGAKNSVVDHTYVYASGDDSDSNVSYGGEAGGPVNGSLVQWNNLTNNTFARGISALGGENFTFQNNLVQNIQGAGFYLAQENPSQYNESPLSNVIAQYNYITNTDISGGQAGIMLYSNDPGAAGVTNVQLSGNYLVNINSSASASILLDSCSGCTLSDVSFTNNTITGGPSTVWANSGTSTNVQCSGNTYNGAASSGPQCGGTNPDTATGSPVTYFGCVVGTARQYTGSITVTNPATIKAVAVFPGLTNSSVGSTSYTSAPAVAKPTF
jgi:Chitobiase/beta-hexosaminidase C-terminal domain